MKRKLVGIVVALVAVLLLASTVSPILADDGTVTDVRLDSALSALAIVAPMRTETSEDVTMTVYQRNNGDTVKDAAVFALTREEAEALKARVEELVELGIRYRDLDWESLLSSHTLLGTTNGSGQLKHSFSDEGWYLLVAIKGDNIPGRTGIAVITIPQALAIVAPMRTETSEDVTMTVYQRNNGDTVKDAAVFALTREEAEALKARVEELVELGIRYRDLDWESLLSSHTLLGTTNGSGQLKHSFSDEGWYLLVAIKGDNIPGRTGIAVITIPQTSTVETVLS
ncbi:hypothetical protein ACFLVI_03735 [Chloroflexota bacterium]